MSARGEATARVLAALDNGDAVEDADLMLCEPTALMREQLTRRAADPLTAADYPLPPWVTDAQVQRGEDDAARRAAKAKGGGHG